MNNSAFYQTGVLVQRSLKIIMHDRKKILMIIGFPLVIAFVINWVAGEDMLKNYSGTQACLFMVVCSTIFVGICNAIQEICGERNIVKREYMANLSLVSYISAKMIVQAIISAVEVGLSGIVYAVAFSTPAEKFPELDNSDTFFELGRIPEATDSVLLPTVMEMLVSLYIIMLAANALGLLISALVKTSDAANTIAPYLLIVQIVFSGVLFDMKGAMNTVAGVMFSKWGMGLMAITYQMEELYPEEGTMMAQGMRDMPAIYEMDSGNILLYWGILLGSALLCLVVAALVLRNVAKDTR